jgi:hypothetical protein
MIWLSVRGCDLLSDEFFDRFPLRLWFGVVISGLIIFYVDFSGFLRLVFWLIFIGSLLFASVKSYLVFHRFFD